MTKLTCISPIDDSLYAERNVATTKEIEQILANAASAQRRWKQTSIAERVQICAKMVDNLVSKADALAPELTWQMGRPLRYTPNEIVGGFQERARYMISIAETALRDVHVSKKEGFTRFIRREPLGVVLTLAPWNYPYLTSVNSIIPAIMAGNAVILKHAQQTMLVAERYAEAFTAAGLPESVFQFLHLTHADVDNVIRDPRIDFVVFTGSVAGGKAIQQSAAARFTGTTLELGGKDPAYVRADANLDHAIENVVDGAFFNSGQSCCGIERVYVHENIYNDFVDGAAALTRQYKLGNPLDPEITLGPMVRTRNAELVRGHIAEAVAKGAKALIDPKNFPADTPGTPYLAPQILINVDHTMRVMREETFGPVMGVMKVKSDAEAIRLMNDSDYGLTASVWTTDEAAALSIGEQVNTGTLFMNRCDYLDPALAWTGVKNSGRGCSLSALGYENLTRPKSYHLRIKI